MFAAFASVVLRSRLHAIFSALIFSLMPLGSWISAVIMALVTLRKGAREGFILLLWCALPSVVVGYFHGFWLSLESIALYFGVVWLCAVWLRTARSWDGVMTIVTCCGLLMVGAFYVLIGDVHHYWLRYLMPIYEHFSDYSHLNLSHQQIETIAFETAEFITGLQVALILIGDLAYLLCARSLQASLFNPRGLGKELRNIRMSAPAMLFYLCVMMIAWLKTDMAYDLLPVLLLPFIATGISLLHYTVAERRASVAWLSGFYALLMIGFPYVAMALVLVSIADVWFDFRKRLRDNTLTSA